MAKENEGFARNDDHGLDHEMVMMVHRQAMGCGDGKENEGYWDDEGSVLWLRTMMLQQQQLEAPGATAAVGAS